MSRVAVVGLGKLGAVMAAVIADAGNIVVGVDINEVIVAKVCAGIAPVDEPGLQDMFDRVRGNLVAVSDLRRSVSATDIAFVIVPTPSLPDGGFDHSMVLEAITEIGRGIKKYKKNHYTVVISSTVMPGTCNDILQPALDEAAGHHVSLCYSPEFIALGSVIADMRHPDMVLVGADDPDAADAMQRVLSDVVRNNPPFVAMSVLNAEVAKIAVNSYVTMKISFANQLAQICEAIPDANSIIVARVIGLDRRIGHDYLKPGAPFGGPCFPRDNRAFQAVAHRHGTTAPLAAATDEVNDSVVQRVVDMLPATGNIAILGMTYKSDTAVTEESFGSKLLSVLTSKGRTVDWHDPSVAHISAWVLIRNSAHVVVCTPWPEYAECDYTNVEVVIDAWGIIPDAKNVRRIGVG